MSVQATPSPANSLVDRDKIYQWILELTNPDTRENVLLELRSVIYLYIFSNISVKYSLLKEILFLQ